MIDIEYEVYNSVAEELRNTYPNINVVGEYVRQASKFPLVSVIEMNNYVYERTQTSSNVENHSRVMYEVNVYSNKAKLKKKECKDIIALVDKVMGRLGFVRKMMNPIPNLEDTTIYRIVARYEAVVSKENIIYRG